MKSFNNNNIETTIRNMLIKQSGLDSIQVLNASSIRGIALDKYVEDVKLSLDVDDILILFRCEQEDSNENLSIITSTDEEYIYAIYTIYIIVYGRDGNRLANILRGRIESEKNRIEMFNDGIYIQQVSSVMTITEFKNETVWPRTDFTFIIGVKYQIDEIDPYENIENENNLVINSKM